MMVPKHEILEWQVPVKDLARNGLTLKYDADDRELEAIRIAYDLHKILDFRLKVELQQNQQGVITVIGKVVATVEQTCVVTLEPVEEKISIMYDRLLVQGGNKGRRSRKQSVVRDEKPHEVVIDPLENDPPDILTGHIIDLGGIALEEFSLELNPYPRHENALEEAELSSSGGGNDDVDDETASRPFAILKKIQVDSS